jgi:hypothetical protein
MGKVRWGILSTAKIGIEKVIPAMQQSELHGEIFPKMSFLQGRKI